MVDFISEVQEELRKDDYNRWLRKYGPYVAALLVAIVMAAAYIEWKKAHDNRQSEQLSAVYLQAAEAAEAGASDQAFNEFLNMSQDAPAGYAGLSLMRAAEIKLDEGDQAEAVRLLDEAANAFEYPRHQQLAQLKAAYILTAQGRYDDVRMRVTPLSESEQPYAFLAKELLGFIEKETGNYKAAREQFLYLERIPGAPPGVQARARQYLSLIKAGTADGQATPLETEMGDASKPSGASAGSGSNDVAEDGAAMDMADQGAVDGSSEGTVQETQLAEPADKEASDDK